MSDGLDESMTGARQIEKVLFADLQELEDPAGRRAFIEQVCHGNKALQARLEQLVAVSEAAEEFFKLGAAPGANGRLAATVAAAAARPVASGAAGGDTLETTNTVIGRYRLLQRIGEGGCGVVYQAEQEQPLRRLVALKIIRLGMDTENVIARFEAERQALALMDHPNIANVLDAGTTESGRPYFVMELVHGPKITDYCDRNHLDTRERLVLFIQICHAIQHAHQKGVVHRDIKPSNILVTLHDGQPVPKVIDFGIAKATQGRLTDNTLYTASDQFIGTPAYMSPEQANVGLDVDTRSDIYSLGVLLYELLTGQTPFDSKELVERGMDELRRTLLEREPRPPSTLLTTLGKTQLTSVAAQHHAEAPQLISTLRGDLDWIVMKALEKDRQRRYETANGLAMDVQRYLNNEPVVARPPSSLYRLQKLVRRNQLTFAAVGAVAVALLVGLGVSTVLFLREREARQQAAAAEFKQIRLREEAEVLRQQAETHQKLTQATLYLSRDQIEDADQLVSILAVPEVNLEYADLFRSLGDWHAIHGRWKPAADRLHFLLNANQPDNWDVTTLDYLRYGPALLELGDSAGYDAFRRLAAARYAGTTNPIPAERVVKVSLLTPADAKLLGALAPFALVASNSLAGPISGGQSLAAWRSFSLALMAYRQGNYAVAEDWCKRSAAFDTGNLSRSVNLQLVQAMTHYRLGQYHLARTELAEARAQVESQFNKGLEVGDGVVGFWFDWVFARTILREAIALMEEPE